MTDVIITRVPGAVSVISSSGPAGPAGPPGASGAATADITATAGQAVGGNRAVRASGAGVFHASSSQPGPVIGVTTHAAGLGESVAVRVSGPMTEPSWTWGYGPVYLGENGLLTQTPPTTGAVREVGTAVSGDTLLIRIQPEIMLWLTT